MRYKNDRTKQVSNELKEIAVIVSDRRYNSTQSCFFEHLICELLVNRK